MLESLKETQQAWIAALRSGDYTQGKQLLRNHRSNFCCLGVLCDLVAAEVEVAEWVDGDDYWEFKFYSPDHMASDGRSSELMPATVRDLVGMSSGAGEFDQPVYVHPDTGELVPQRLLNDNQIDKAETCYSSLVDMNDEGVSFEHIADFIEAYPADIFEGWNDAD